MATEKRSRPSLYPARTRAAKAEQALAFYKHAIEAAVQAGWDRDEMEQAALRMALAVDPDDPQLTAEEAAAAETARKYSGTTPEWRREDHVIHTPEV